MGLDRNSIPFGNWPPKTAGQHYLPIIPKLAQMDRVRFAIPVMTRFELYGSL